MNQSPDRFDYVPPDARSESTRKLRSRDAARARDERVSTDAWLREVERREPARAPVSPARIERPQTSKPIKVAHVVLALNMGGLERMVLRLLAGTDRSRFSPFVCALDEPGELATELSRLGVPLVTLGRKAGFDAGLVLRLARWLAREEIDVVHTHNAGPHLYGALAANLVRLWRGRGPRVIHTKHGVGAWTSTIQPRMNQLAARLSERVIAVSDHMREHAIKSDRVTPEKLLTVLNGVDFHEFSTGGDRATARARLGVPLHGLHIGCVARLSPVKDHATMIEAFALVKAKRPNAHLTLVGDGSTREDLQKLAAKLGLEGSVTFAGTRLDIPELLPAFDIFALSSLTEGTSLTLIEAAAAGLPIVATRVGGNADIVEDQKSGILVPPRDAETFATALLAVASRPDRARMGLRGRQRVLAKFSIDRMTEAYQSLYDQVASA